MPDRELAELAKLYEEKGLTSDLHAERQQCQERLLGWLAANNLNWFVEDLSSTGLTRSSRLVIVSTSSGGGGE